MNRKAFVIALFFAFTSIELMAQLETIGDSLVVQSNSFRHSTGSIGGAYSTTFFYYHTFKAASDDGSQWVGVYGGKIRKQFEIEGESKKYLNRFRNWGIAKQASSVIVAPIIGYYAYNAWVNDDFFSNQQIALIVASALPGLVISISPYCKKSALKKTAIHYNRSRLR